MTRRVIGLAAVWLVISLAVLLAPGCYGRNCEAGIQTYGTDAGQGRMLTADRWESNPVDGTWLWFPRQQYYIFDVRALNGRTPQLIIPYLSATPEPKNGNFTLGSGNLALLSNALPNRVDIHNDSCSDYYLRLVIDVNPFPPATADAGEASPDDAGVTDAETDADTSADADAGL